MMRKVSKLLISTLAGVLILVSTAAPAEARRRHHRHHHDDVDAGDVIGAAIVIGGIAALFSASKNDGYGGTYGAERKAVKACVKEAERGGFRYNGAVVRRVTDVDQRDGYFHVSGVLETRGPGAAAYPGGPMPGDDYIAPEGIEDGFSCTARGKRVYDFQRSSGYHW